jgi:hypothetical protein
MRSPRAKPTIVRSRIEDFAALTIIRPADARPPIAVSSGAS